MLVGRIRIWIGQAALLVSLLVVAGRVLAYSPGDPEFRAFWVDTWGTGILSQSEVDTLLGVPGTSTKGQIRDANCNAVVIEVRRNCDACYPSSMGEPYMSGLSPANFNALQAVINAAHDTTGGKKRIEVHAWIVTFRTSGGLVYTQHSDPPTGSLTNLDNYWPTCDDTGAETDDKAFDPGHPLCEEYTANVAMDIVNNFDVDGIHFDYIRFTANNQGYNPTSVARYNARYGLTGQPSASDEQWKQWRRDQVTNLVRKVYAKVQASKPWVKVSGAFVTWNPSPTASTRAAFQATRPYYDVYSDWDSWIQEGIVDCAMPMTYYDLGGSYAADWTRWINFEKDRHGTRHMYIGPGLYLNSLSNAITELQQTRTASPAGNYAEGWCGYSYRVPYVSGTWSGFSPSLVSNVTSTWADIPAMSWKTNPTKGHISGTVTIASTGKWADGALVTITGPQSRSQYVDGTGFYAFIDLTPGVYTVTASLAGQPNGVRTVNVQVGAVTGNMYVTDIALGAATPPAISNVQATNIGPTAATITWNTDQNSDSQVEYGLTSTYGWSTPVDSTQVTSHSVALTGLSPNTLYHYRVKSSNANGSSTSGDYTFTTSSGVPVIANVQTSNITNNSATITWTTNIASSSTVNYGLTSSYGSQRTDSSQVTSHSITLTGLSAKTTYHYQCVSTNAYGTATSTDYTFTTNGPPVISNVQSTGVTASTATITWTTDVASDSTVNYGTTTSYGSQQTNASQVTSHSISLSGLTPQTTYHYQCVSTNAYGTATSADYTFTTSAAPVEIIVDDTDPGWTTTGTWTQGTYSGGWNDTYWYCYNRKTSSTATSTWTPNLPTAGTYDVYCWYTSGSNRTAKVTYRIYYSGGSTTKSLSQRSNGSQWVLLASGLPFDAGTGGYVMFNNVTGEANDSYVIIADAIKWVRVGGDTAPPTVPTGLAATPASTTSMSLSWTASTDDTGVAGYKIYRNSTLVGTSATTSYTDSGLTANTQYTYAVSAYDAAGNESAQSSSVSKYTLGIASVVCDRTAGQYYNTTPFTFTNAGIGAGKVSSYRFAWDNSATHTWTDTETGWTTTQTVVNASGAAAWYFHVRGYNGDGVPTAATDMGPYYYDATPPTLPTLTLDRTLTNAANVQATFGGSTDANFDHYELRLDSDSYAIATSPYIIVVSGLSEAAHTVYVRGVDKAGNASTAASASFTIDRTAPSIPANLAATAASTTSMALSWSASTDATGVAGYRVYRGGALIASPTTTSYMDTGLAANTQYSYTVSAFDGASNESIQSGAAARYTLSTPPTGSIISCSASAGSWSSSPSFEMSNTGFGPGKVSTYRYVWDGSPTHTWTDSEPTWTTTSKTLTADTTTHPFYFHVKGYNGDGVGNGTLDLGPYNYGVVYDTIAAAMNNPDGSGVIIQPNNVVSAVFADSFYIEQADRTRGIRVDATTALAVGSSVRLGGRLAGASGERKLIDAAVTDYYAATAPRPLHVRIADLGGSSPDAFTSGLPAGNGTYNIGLLVRVAGVVKSHSTGWFVLEDGSGATVKVYSDKLVTDQSYVAATGISTIESGQRVIRTRSQDDVRQYAP